MVKRPHSLAAFADAGPAIGPTLRRRLAEWARQVHARAKRLDREFNRWLTARGFDRRQRKALRALTPGAAAELLVAGRPLREFLEQVEYSGRRLAKLNIPPSTIQRALSAYKRMLDQWVPSSVVARRRCDPAAADQLYWSILLAINRAYYQVREREAAAFYKLFRGQLAASNLEELLASSVATLAEFCGAAEAQCYLVNREGQALELRASVAADGTRFKPRSDPGPPVSFSRRLARILSRPRSEPLNRTAGAFLDPSWHERFSWGWSIPLREEGRLLGVFQFAFAQRYDWLPRERALLEAAAERCTGAIDKARLVEDLAAREEQVRALAEHLIHVEEIERQRISRELHDEAGQSLLYLRLQLEMLEKSLGGSDLALKQKLAELREICERTILETRRLIAALSPAVLEQLGLAAAIKQLVRRFRQAYPCQVHLRLGSLAGLPKPMETVVYRLLQECCNNIAKHSKARNVNIRLELSDEILRVEVEDDGIGFCVPEALSRTEAFGLRGMRERVALLGGVLQIQSPRPSARGGCSGGGAGCRIVAELPVPRQNGLVREDQLTHRA